MSDDMIVGKCGFGTTIRTGDNFRVSDQNGVLHNVAVSSYPTLSDVVDMIKKRDADILAMTATLHAQAARMDAQYGLIQLLTKRLSDLEHGVKPQFEKILGA